MSDVREEGGVEPLLRLYHDGPWPDARQTGLILERLANAFRQHTRLGTIGVPAHLVVQEIYTSSLLVLFKDLLDAGSAFITLYEHRELLGGFVAQLNDTLSLMRGLGDAPAPMYRTAIEAMSAPVRTGNASHLQLSVVGDNNTILIIDQAAAFDVQRFLDSRPRSIPDEPHRAVDVLMKPRSLEPQRMKESIPVAAQQKRIDPVARPAGWDGTLVWTQDGWMVRPEGYGGALFPLSADSLDVSNFDKRSRPHVSGYLDGSRYVVEGFPTPP